MTIATERPKRVLVTGGTGFIGAHLIPFLQRKGHYCIALGTGSRQVDYPFANADIRDLADTASAVQAARPDVIIHLASSRDGHEDYEQARRGIETNVLGTLNVLEAARLADCEMFIYGDSTKSYGDCQTGFHSALKEKPSSSYGLTKLAGWHLCQLYGRIHGILAVGVRPTLVYGPGQPNNLVSAVIAKVREGAGSIELMGGEQTRDPIYIGDLVEVYALAMENITRIAGNLLTIGGGCEMSVREIARAIADALGAEMVINSSQPRSTDTLRNFCDNDEVADLLGWRPRTPFKQGIRAIVDQIE